MTAVEICVLAQDDPVAAMRAIHALVTDSILAANVDFDHAAAAQLARESSVALGLAADVLKEHARSRPFVQRRPTAKQGAAIHAEIDTREAEEAAHPGSWKAI